MSIPQVNVSDASEGCIGVLAALTSAQQTMTNAKLAFFLDIVPVRGDKLWERFRTYQKKSHHSSFSDFINEEVAADPMKIFYPNGCTLDDMTRGFLLPEIAKAVGSVINTDDEILGIHFGSGPAFDAVQRIACKGCNMTNCPHFTKFKGKQH